MKAVVIYEPGGPEKLIYQDVETPKVKEGWTLIKIKAFGINHSETITRKGLSPTVKFPRILGIECTGVVEETSDPSRFHKGEEICSIMGEMGRDYDGSYAEYVLLPNDQIYTIDRGGRSWEETAAIPETYYTAYGSVENLRIEENDKVLVRGGTSGVGLATVNLIKGKYPNVEVTGTTRKMEKADKMEAAGFDKVVQDKDGVLQTKENYTKILELVGPATMKESFQHLSPGGILCDTGELGENFALENFAPLYDMPANSYLTSFYSGDVDQKRIDDMFAYMNRYEIHVKPEKVFDLPGVPDAHRYLESGESFGKVVVVP